MATSVVLWACATMPSTSAAGPDDGCGGGLLVRLSGEGHYEDYLTREWVVSEVRIHDFIYD